MEAFFQFLTQCGFFEAVMMFAFGASWPFAIAKTLKAKNPAGKSFAFLWLVLVGYICGCIHKCLTNLDGVLFLYILNGLMVATDLTLCYYYAFRIRQAKETSAA